MDLSAEQLAAIFSKVTHIPDMGSSIDVPHPMTIKNTRETTITDWYPSADPRDIDQAFPGGLNCVRGRIVKVENFDDYHEPIGKPEYVLHHKFDHPQRKDRSVCAAPLRPRNMAGEKNSDGVFTAMPMRKRFPDAFVEFEKALKRDGKPLPIALLDNVPPEVTETLIAMGFDTVQAFADLSDENLGKLKLRLDTDKHSQRSGNAEVYRDRAREYVGYEARKPAAKKAA